MMRCTARIGQVRCRPSRIGYDANDHYDRLNRINGFDPAKHGNNDVLFGLNGDDLIIGDGNQSVLEQQAGSQKGNRDILVGGTRQRCYLRHGRQRYFVEYGAIPQRLGCCVFRAYLQS